MKRLHQIIFGAAMICFLPSVPQLRAEDTQVPIDSRKGDRAIVPHEADNTGKNIRDRNGAMKTASNQGSSKADRKLAAAIRRSVMKEKALSTNAHNVKIIVAKGVVTLRGPVASEEERELVAKKATDLAGIEKVKNDLEITR